MYEELCEELDWPVDADRLAKLRSANEEKLTAFDAKIADAEENLGDVEVREARAAKAFYLCKIGEAAYRENVLHPLFFRTHKITRLDFIQWHLVVATLTDASTSGNSYKTTPKYRYLIRLSHFINSFGGTLHMYEVY